ncbi:ABC transporter ATP-binding protein [Paraburkholderia sp. JPY303]|nr:ABC transporter ATP-binding protein [Paraburkholderia atlantica]
MMAKKKPWFDMRAFKCVLVFTVRYWRKQPVRISAIATLALLATLAEVVTPFFSGRLVDALTAGGGDMGLKSAAWHHAASTFGLLIALGVGTTLARHFTLHNIMVLTLNMISDVASNAFCRVQRLSTDWHANSFAGSTVHRITRGMWALELMNDTLLLALLPSLLMLGGATILLGVRWPLMGVLVGAGSLLYITVAVSLSLGYVAPAAHISNLWDTRMGGRLADAIACNSLVKAFGAESREEARFARIVSKWRKHTARMWARSTTNGGVQSGMLVLMQTAMLSAALWFCVRDEASVGDIAFALTMFYVLQGYLREVGMHVRNLQRSVNDMQQLVLLERERSGIEDRPGARPIEIRRGEICFDRVTFQYDKVREPLYKDFSVTIAPGERVGLVGRSGAGKTTFIKLIQRLYDLSDGRIRIDGQDISQVEQTSLRRQIAIVQQEPLLFHRSLAENIAYGKPDATQAEIEQASALANAHEFIAALPNGYATLVGDRGVKLSGGERQRVAIARAFLADAPIIILDEATSNLDGESEVLIQQAMERLMVGRTTLVAAHRLSTVRALDRLLVFDHGRLVEEGSHDRLVQLDDSTYRRLFDQQGFGLAREI